MKVYKTLPDGIEIVEYEDSLAQAVADMWNKSGEGWGGSFDSGVYTAERVIAKRNSGVFYNVYIAMKNGEALGYCSFNRYNKDADTAYVHVLNVRPDHHGKGLGRELVLMCVNETIARGMPRLDIHTWPGNTKAVPMYKKCGYFWEDRADTTHLSNFIPTVLATELVKDFFETADWYADSTRKIEIKPDGVKVNKFELYEYEWEKDGAQLRVGFEKTGRRINLIETDDYKIELKAVNHDLAYGMSYPCEFYVKNKTGKDLNVSITAKSNDVIRFEGSWAENVADESIFKGTFYVGEITEAQDDMRMHPCVLADVTINGKSAEFGLGIEPKFPVMISLGRKDRVARPGMTEIVYINVKNGLSTDATVRFALPQNPLLKFDQSNFEIDLIAGKDASVATTSTLTECGYSETPITFEITTSSGDNIKTSRPLHIVNQGLSGHFRFETDDCYGAVNGLWRLRLLKKNNDVYFERIAVPGFLNAQVSQLGTPYEDEFNLIKPADIRVIYDEAFIKFEADFISGKFPGAVMTEIYEFDQAGCLNRRCRVSNKGSADLDLSMKLNMWSTHVGKRAVYPYDGAIHWLDDKMNYGFDTLDKEKLDENWVFDLREDSPSGFFWPVQNKPDVRWGDLLVFEIPTGVLSPGQVYESGSIVYMCGVFKNYKDFRNYVLDINEDRLPLPHNHLEAIVNGGNPVFSTGVLDLTLRNNRQNIRDGVVSVSSPDGLFNKETQTNPDDLLCPENNFHVQVANGQTGMQFVDFSCRLSGYEINSRHTLLITDDTAIKTVEQDGVLTVENGKFCYKMAPGFSDAVFSMQYDGNEWLLSNYPSLEPFAWWNPFVGGIKTNLERMGTSFVLRENISASFVTETDCFGNTWRGMCSEYTVQHFDEYIGVRCRQYFLTLPGVPMLCHFTRVENNTGRYIDAELFSMLFLADRDTLHGLCAEMVDGSLECKVHPGSVDDEFAYDRLMTITREDKNLRPEKLYIFKDSARDNGKHCIGMDNDVVYCDFNMEKSVPNGGSYTTMPIFCLLSEKGLTLESLDDLRRVEF